MLTKKQKVSGGKLFSERGGLGVLRRLFVSVFLCIVGVGFAVPNVGTAFAAECTMPSSYNGSSATTGGIFTVTYYTSNPGGTVSISGGTGCSTTEYYQAKHSYASGTTWWWPSCKTCPSGSTRTKITSSNMQSSFGCEYAYYTCAAAGTCSANQYWNGSSCVSCPSGYPYSAGGTKQPITTCYSATKSRAVTCTQNSCSTPSGCASATCASSCTCSGSACDYVAYANSAGTGDGTIKSGCSTNAKSCTKAVSSVTAKSNYYVSGTSCYTCSGKSSTYTLSDGGSIDYNKCYYNRTRTCNQNNGSTPSGCASVTAWNSCSCAGGTYKYYYNGTSSGTTTESCTKTAKTVTANANYYVSGATCPSCSSKNSSYPYSAGGSIDYNSCYKNVTRTCNQNNGSTPSGCASVTAWNSCSCAGGTYKLYLSGNTSGTTTAESCTKTAKTVTASANYFVSGSACAACSTLGNSYTLSDGGNIGASSCYTNVKRGCDQKTGSTPSGCASVTAWNSCSCAGGTYKKYYSGSTSGTTSNETCTQTAKTVTASANYYVSGATCPSCSSKNSSYPYSAGGSIDYNSCYYNRTRTCNQNNGSTPSGCASVTAWNSCSCAGGTYKQYLSGSTSGTTTESCTKTAKTVTASANYYVSGATCKTCSSYSSTYTLSDGGSISYTSCYYNQKRGCTQNNGSTPSGCASVTAWNSCSCAGGTYKQYLSGSTSGTTSNETCTKTAKTVTASANYFVSGSTCAACKDYASGYNKSDGGSIDMTWCYKDGTKSGSQKDPAMQTGCAARTTSACTVGTCTYKDYYSQTDTTCTPADCTKGQTCTSASAGYYLSSGSATACGGNNYYCTGGTAARATVSTGYYSTGGGSTTRTGQSKCEANNYCASGVKTACPTSYPNSDAGTSSDSYCYAARTNTGKQNNGDIPSGCASVTEWNACTPGTCSWRDYKSATDTSCTPSDCKKTAKTVTASANYFVSGSVCAACKDYASGGYNKSDGGSIDMTWCYKDGTKYGSQKDPAMPTGCAARTLSACSVGSCTYKDYYSQTDTTCTPSDCTKGQTCTSTSANYYLSSGTAKQCPSAYPNSVAGSTAITSCYSNTRSRAWTGKAVEGSVPPGCASVTAWNSCSNSACNYTVYSNSAGTGDGTHRDGCSSNSANCTMSPKTVTASANYFVSGSACAACSVLSNEYKLSDGGSIDAYSCYTNVTRGCDQENGVTPSGCASVTEWNSCSCTGGTYKKYYGGATSGTTSNETCTKTVKSVRAKANYYVSGVTCPSCPSAYPNSEAGSTAITSCYSNTRSRAWTGSQTACSKPDGCATVTCNTCSNSACNYTVYSNSSGTGDGTHRDGCSSNSAACQQTIKSVTASPNYFVSGLACAACSVLGNPYKLSDGGDITASYCYQNVTKSGSQKDPEMQTGCAARTTSACSVGSCTYKDYYGQDGETCTGASDCTKGQTCTSASPGYYVSSGSATACGGNSYYCPGGTETRKTVSTGYYSTGGGETTRSGQTKCEENNYCVSGVKAACPTSYPSSDAGISSDSYCYAVRTNTGSQNDGDIPDGCATVTAWNACTPGTCNWRDYKGATDTTCTPSDCKKTAKTVTAKKNYFVDGSACASCTYAGGGFELSDGGSITVDSCYKEGTKYGSQNDPDMQTGCAIRELTACGVGSCTYKDYFNKTDETCTPADCTKGQTCTSTEKNYYLSDGTAKQCPSAYPNSVAGSTAITSCYSNTRSRAWTGKAVEGDTPEGCYQVVTWESCSLDACNYTVYSNSAGTGDGTHRDGCSSNSENCTKTPVTVAADKDHYVDGITCPSCSSIHPDYPLGHGGAYDHTWCYKTVDRGCIQKECSSPSNCATATCASSCSCDEGWYILYYSGKTAGETEDMVCTKEVLSVTADVNHYVANKTCQSCSSKNSEYPNSEGGNISFTSCFSNIRWRDWIGDVDKDPVPSGCEEAEWNSCSHPRCEYVAYLNEAGTGDGIIKSGCSVNNAVCTKGLRTVSAKSGHYVEGLTCPSCSDFADGFYPNSEAGNTGDKTACYTDELVGQYVAVEGDDYATDCTSGEYKGKHTVNYGSTSIPETCPTGYAGSDGTRIANTDCYASCDAKTISGGTTTVVNAKEYYTGSAYPACTYNVNCNVKYGASGNETSNPACTLCDDTQYSAGGTATCSDCEGLPENASYVGGPFASSTCSWECNSGYGQTSANQCAEMCTAGFQHLKSSTGISVPLYTSAQTTHSIVVKSQSGAMCYASLASGAGSNAINVNLDGTTYHTIY